MYNTFSIIFLFSALVSIGRVEFKEFIFLCLVSVGFAIAGSIQSLIFRIDKILDSQLKIKIRNLINNDTVIDFEKKND